MFIAALVVLCLGCATILLAPRFTRYWRTLEEAEPEAPAAPQAGFQEPRPGRDPGIAPVRRAPDPGYDPVANATGRAEHLSPRAAPSR
jgi:hypothetical protein